MTSQYEIEAERRADDPAMQPIVLSRGEFNELIEMIKGALRITQVRMADGSVTSRMCTACEMFPMLVHQIGHVSCSCVCHKMREKLEKFDAM